MTEKQMKSTIVTARKRNERVYVNDKNEVWTNITSHHNVTLQTANIIFWIDPRDVTLKKPNADGTDDTYFPHSGNSTLDEDNFLTISELVKILNN